MKLSLMPPGRPTSPLGIGHTLKHYLNPRELWEDIADAIPEDFRPLAASRKLPRLDPPAWQQYEDPPAALQRLWPWLGEVYREGYGALITTLSSPLPEPNAPGASSTWVRVRRKTYSCHAGDGVILSVYRSSGQWRLRTAFRAMDFKLDCHECPPRDARSVSLRRKMAVHQAERLIARKRPRSS